MLTQGDDYPIHQTAEPIASSGTDRNFYDRYFFNGYQSDGSGFFAVAFGVYPHLNVADAHLSFIRDGVQHCLHASRLLAMERMDLSVGPIRIEIVEPLNILRIVVSEHEGISADLTFTGRAFPVEEPRFTRRIGPRTFMDYTRMTQNGHWSGWIEKDGVREDVGGSVGTRDRSWGVRPIGASDPQPSVPQQVPQFFWLWSPVNFTDASLFFHINADQTGKPWNSRAVWCPDKAGPADRVETERASMSLTLIPGMRHASSANLRIEAEGQPAREATFQPLTTFLMRGLGYGHPSWAHGGWKGELVVEREDIDLTNIVPGRPDHVHIQAVCKVTLSTGGETHVGTGILEQFIIGAYAPLGLTSLVAD
ncbi:MAG: hypothetical protein ACK51R_00930 [Hyphomonadaceae bacterium]|jgi:hypothetical protein